MEQRIHQDVDPFVQAQAMTSARAPDYERMSGGSFHTEDRPLTPMLLCPAEVMVIQAMAL